MSTTLLIDSACDLPQSFLTKYDVKVLPATILYDGHSMPDYRDTEKTISLYESGVLDKGHESDTAPTSAQTIQKLLEHTTDKIQHGLLSPFVCVSYAGHLDEITALPEFQRLQTEAREHKNQVIVTPMSLSGGVNLGPPTLSVAFACEH